MNRPNYRTVKQILLLVFITSALYVMDTIAMLATMGSSYEEISGPGGMQELSTMPFTDEMFHQCSLSSTCVYVVKDTRNNKYKMYDNENDIPDEKKALRIWKKAQGECYF